MPQLYGLVKTVDGQQEVVARRTFENTPPVYGSEEKGIWLPIVEVRDQITNSVTQRLNEVPDLDIDETSITYTYSVRTLNVSEAQTLREQKLARISERFDTKTFSPIQFTLESNATKTFDADSKARSRLSAILTLISVSPADVPNPRSWTAYNELAPTSLTHTDFLGLALAIAAREDSLFVVKKTKEAQLAAINNNNPTAIDALDTDSGW